MKQQKQRRDEFSQGPVADSLPSAALSGHVAGSALQRAGSRDMYQGGSSTVAIDMPGSESHFQGSQAQMMAVQVSY